MGIRAKEQDFLLVPDRVDEFEEVAKPVGPSDDFAISTINGSKTAQTGSFQDLLKNAYDDPVGEPLIMKLRYRLGS